MAFCTTVYSISSLNISASEICVFFAEEREIGNSVFRVCMKYCTAQVTDIYCIPMQNSALNKNAPYGQRGPARANLGKCIDVGWCHTDCHTKVLSANGISASHPPLRLYCIPACEMQITVRLRMCVTEAQKLSLQRAIGQPTYRKKIQVPTLQ